MTKEETVERIVDLYTHTRMSLAQFKNEVDRLLTELPMMASDDDGQARYDKGFSDGYDSRLVEEKENAQ